MSDEAAVREIKPTPVLYSKEELLGIERPKEMFTPPGHGKAVEIRALNALQQSEYQSSLMEMTADEKGKPHTVMKMEGHNIRLVSMGMTVPKLTYEQVGGLDNGFVASVAERIREISGMKQTVEEAEGN